MFSLKANGVFTQVLLDTIIQDGGKKEGNNALNFYSFQAWTALNKY